MARSPDATTAQSYLQKAAQELQAEISELIAIGARHFVVTGIDVGIIPDYDGLVDEAASPRPPNIRRCSTG